MKYKDFLRFNKAKIILSMSLSIIWVGIGPLIQFINEQFSNKLIVPAIGYTPPSTIDVIGGYVILFLWWSFLNYIFACGIYFIFKAYKEKNIKSVFKEKKIIFSIILFNPFVLTFFGTIILLLTLQIKYSQYSMCGVSIDKVINNSPAFNSNLSTDMVMISINNETIYTVEDFLKILNTTSPSDQILLKTYSKNFKNIETTKENIINLGENPNSQYNTGYLGVHYSQMFHKNCDFTQYN